MQTDFTSYQPIPTTELESRLKHELLFSEFRLRAGTLPRFKELIRKLLHESCELGSSIKDLEPRVPYVATFNKWEYREAVRREIIDLHLPEKYQELAYTIANCAFFAGYNSGVPALPESFQKIVKMLS
ncbi:hypothetical protein KY329_04755 [Candidatus Woesearchaeota archaeon]|nr:hypothetical protein [Candidatus Woesearchaeota archaeon]